MSETFGLTGVEIEQQTPQKIDTIQEKEEEQEEQEHTPPKKKPLVSYSLTSLIKRQRIHSHHNQSSNMKSTDKLPKLTTNRQSTAGSDKNSGKKRLPRTANNMKTRSLSSQTLPVQSENKKVLDLRKILEQQRRNEEFKEIQQRRAYVQPPMPKSASSFMLQYEQKIKSDMDCLYSSRDLSKMVGGMTQPEQKYALNIQFQKNQKLLQKEMGLSNQMSHEISMKEKQLNSLKLQIKNTKIQLESNGEQEELERIMGLYEDLSCNLAESLEYEKILQHMLKQRQKIVTFIKGQINSQTTELEEIRYQTKIAFIQNKQDLNMYLFNNKELNSLNGNGPMTMETIQIDQRFENMLEKELEEFENHKAVKELERQEQFAKKQYLQDKKKQKEEDMIKKLRNQQLSMREMKREHREIDLLLQQLDKMFEELQRATQKKGKELIGYKQDLKYRKVVMEDLKNEFNEKIAQEKITIEALKDEIKILQYADLEDQQKNNKNEDQQQDDQNDENEDEYEQEFELSQEQLQQQIEQGTPSKYQQVERQEQKRMKENELARIVQENLVRSQDNLDNMCIIASKILYQLKIGNKSVNCEVSRQDLPEVIEIISDILENMQSEIEQAKKYQEKIQTERQKQDEQEQGEIDIKPFNDGQEQEQEQDQQKPENQENFDQTQTSGEKKIGGIQVTIRNVVQINIVRIKYIK